MQRTSSLLVLATCGLLACDAEPAPESAAPPAELTAAEPPLAEPPTQQAAGSTGAPTSTPVGKAADRAAPEAAIAPTDGLPPLGPMVSVECRGGGARASWQRFGSLGTEQAVVSISAAGPRSWRYLFRYMEDEVVHAGLRVDGWKFVEEGKTHDAVLMRDYDYASEELACTARQAEAAQGAAEEALEAAPIETIECTDAKRIARIGADALIAPEGEEAPTWLHTLCDDDPVRALDP